MMTSAIAANTLSSIDEAIEKILPWVHEAGNPYFDFIFDDRDVARAALGRWMRRASSEISVNRAVLLRGDDEPLGGFIALTGAELSTCRRMDAAALTLSGNRERREGVLKRLETTRDLFIPVRDRDFYLSKFWLDTRYRGAGHARGLMNAYLAAGHRGGYSQFRLDVFADNERAIHVYRSFGFKELGESAVPGAGLRYIAMGAEFPPQ